MTVKHDSLKSKIFIVFIIILLQYNEFISDLMFCNNSNLWALLLLFVSKLVGRNHFKGLLSRAASSRDERLMLTFGRDSVKLF